MDNYLEPELAEPFNTWKAKPDPLNTDVLLKKVNPIMTAAIRSYGITGSPTIKSRAKLLTIDALNKYDPTKAGLKTHLMFQLQGLRRYAAKEQQILSLPEQVGLDLVHLNEESNRLQDELGREPSDLELADRTGLSLKRIGYIRKARPSFAEGYFHKPSDEGDDLYSPPIVGKTSPDKNWLEFVYHDLQARDRLIMEYSLGLHGKPKLPNQLIARKLGISPGAVSQRKAKIQDLLDTRDVLGLI